MKFFESCRVSDTLDPFSDRDNVTEEKDMDDNYLGSLFGSVRDVHSGNTLFIDGLFVEQGDRVLINSYRGNLAHRNGIYVVQNLDPGDNFLSVRLSEPTLPNDVWSTSIRYRRKIPETSLPSDPQSRVDRSCPFKLLSAYTTPLQVSSGDTVTYRTQAEGVYHIQSTIYYFPSNSSDTEIYCCTPH
jgi:hypothetical protein